MDFLRRAQDWWSENWPGATVGVILIGCVGLIIAMVISNNNLNRSMIGKHRSDLIEQFGPPTGIAKSREDTEVLEWVRHESGYFTSTWVSDGRGGGYTNTTYIPPHDAIRKAIVRRDVVISCEGGL